jgi:ketosteroid isomerase-like protein
MAFPSRVKDDGHHRRAVEDTPFNVRYVSFITVRGGRVSPFRDYTIPLRPSAR